MFHHIFSFKQDSDYMFNLGIRKALVRPNIKLISLFN